jgi:hypothetical protein
MLFNFPEKMTLTRVEYFLKTYYHNEFQDPVLSGGGVVPTSKVRMASMLILLMVEKHKQWSDLYWHDAHTNFLENLSLGSNLFWRTDTRTSRCRKGKQ